MSKKVTLVLALVVCICSGVISYSLVKSSRHESPVGSKTTISDTQKNSDDEITGGPRTAECPMNGAMYTEGQKQKWETRRPLLVAIENHTEARPQSGLSKADAVYEVVAEGGITRFLADFYCQDANPIGPVRSARMYFLRLVQGYGDHPLYAHVGGANTPGPANALGEIQNIGWEGYNDMNQFAVPFPYYYRDYERNPNRATEHTMYSATSKLWEYARNQRKLSDVDSKGVKWSEGWKPWKFADEAAVADRGTATKISYQFWSRNDSDNYAVSWAYDKATNLYTRSNGGAPHIDKDTNKPIASKNVVVVYAKESPANDGYEGGHLLYDIVGVNGTGLLFQNGKSQKITWKKPKATDMMRFYDATGNEVSFARGQIWVSILPLGNNVVY